jgi:hypothetical protein
VLAAIASSDAELADLFDIDSATNDRLLAENDLLPGIGVHELLFGVPYYRIVNASFTHAHPLGSRFNSPDRGAWYAAFEVRTAQAEVAFHKTVHLAEIGRFDDDVTFDDYHADFSCDLHDLRAAPAFASCLDPDSYVSSQRAPRGRHVHRVLPSRARDERAQGTDVPLSVERARDADDHVGGGGIARWRGTISSPPSPPATPSSSSRTRPPSHHRPRCRS